MRAVIGGLVAAVVMSAVVFAQAPDPAKVAAGKAAYTAQKCDSCHQIAGEGKKVAAALDGAGTKWTAADLKLWLTDPATMEAKLPKKPAMSMAAWTKTHKLTPTEIDNLVAYMQSLK